MLIFLVNIGFFRLGECLMTTFVQTGTEEKKLIPFLKLGEFDEDNYKNPKEVVKAKETEAKYGTLRLLAGESIQGVITGFFDSPNGPVMYIKDAQKISDTSENITSSPVGRVKIPLGLDLAFKILGKLPAGTDASKVKLPKAKQVGESVTILYLGKHPSPKNPSRLVHKSNVE